MAAFKSGAQVLAEEGALAFAKKTLLQSLAIRFGDLPNEISDCIKSTSTIKPLERWIRRFATANSLADVGILPRASARS